MKIDGYFIFIFVRSHDNSRFVSAGLDRCIFLWDVGTGNIVRRIRGHNNKINTLELNKESNILFSGSYDTTIKIWDLKSHNKDPIQTLSDFKDSVSSIKLVDDYILYTASIDGRIRTYDIRKGKLITDHVMESLTNISISIDKNCILVSCLDNSLKLFDTSSGELLNQYKGHVNNKYKVSSCFTLNDAYLITGSEDNNIYMYDMVETNVVLKIKGHNSPVCAIAHHPKLSCIESGSTDGVIKIWKNKEDEIIRKPATNIMDLYHGDDMQVRFNNKKDRTEGF